MPVIRSRIANLPAAHREEVRAILAEARATRGRSSRFESNADEASFLFYVLLAGSVGGLIAYCVVFGNPVTGIPDFWSTVIHYPAAILHDPARLGVQLALPIGIYSAWRIVANYRGNGWALTSFGFAHITRGTLKYIGYGDIAELGIRRGVVGRARRSYTTLEVKARDGSKMTTFAGGLVDGLQSRISPDAKIT